MTRQDLWLEPITEVLRDDAVKALTNGDYRGFLGMASSMYGLDLVEINREVLEAHGCYEGALLTALVNTRTSNNKWPLTTLKRLFRGVDRGRLLAAGTPLPEGEMFELYRGVGGRGSARRIRGVSWTSDRDTADWFTNRACTFGLYDPATYCVTVRRTDVWAYVNERKENEFIVLLPSSATVRRLA